MAAFGASPPDSKSLIKVGEEEICFARTRDAKWTFRKCCCAAEEIGFVPSSLVKSSSLMRCNDSMM